MQYDNPESDTPSQTDPPDEELCAPMELSENIDIDDGAKIMVLIQRRSRRSIVRVFGS
jgi:hypothetical protein